MDNLADKPRRPCWRTLAFLGAGWLAPAMAMGDTPVQGWTPAEVWRGYDPRALPLDVRELKSWQENGCDYQKLTFTGEVIEGLPVRVFALQGAPVEGDRLPGVLHIHGGGQTASLDWVRFWARRGYVCVSFDFCGPWAERTEYTDWGPLQQGNMAHAQGGYQVQPTPHASSWYHWALVSRRALTLLERHPSVDPDRLGVFGISVGGTLTWLVAGSDWRVKAAVPIYGCGYNVDRRKMRWGLPEPTPDQMLYKSALSPEAHAPSITCPIFFLSSTNDHHGWMDDAFEALGAVRGPRRQAFTPRFIHHIEPEEGRGLPLWMDWHLRGGREWPDTPVLSVAISETGELTATVRPADSRRVRHVNLYYGAGERIAPNRYWRRVAAVRRRRGYTAMLPVLDVWDPVHVFANVEYDTGLMLSSEQVRVVPGTLGKARASLAWSPEIAGPASPEDWYFSLAYTDPNIDSRYLRIVEDQGRRCVTLDPALFGDPMDLDIASHAIGDRQWQGRNGMALQFQCRGDFNENGLTVSVTGGEWTPGVATYSAMVPQDRLVGGWRTVTLPLSAFQSEQGRPLTDWSQVEKLRLQGKASRQDPPRFARFRWVQDLR